jgi:Zn-dependent protease
VRETFRFGSIAGIRVGANWSVLIIAWLLAFGLAVSALPEMASGYSDLLYWVAASIAALVFFASLLAHEMAHALVARSKGLPVEGITLWALGGVSKLGGDAPNAGSELKIALVGPATSLALGAALLVATSAIALLDAPELVVATLGWLAVINVVLGLFNLMPALPLDGGRVLRAILWHSFDDRLRATRTASVVAQVFGYVMVGAGAFVFMLGYVVNGIWFALLGWFVINMARVELAQVEQHELLSGVLVGDMMTRAPLCVPPDLSVDRLLDEYVLTRRFSSYPVVDDAGRLLGLITLDGVRRVPPERRPDTTVLRAAIPIDRVPRAEPWEELETALPRLASRPGARLIVTDGDRVVGLVSPRDVVSCIDRAALAGARHPGP